MQTVASSNASASDGAAALGGEGGGGGFAFLGRAMVGGEEREGRGDEPRPEKGKGKGPTGAWPGDSVRRWQRTASGAAFCFPFWDDSPAPHES